MSDSDLKSVMCRTVRNELIRALITPDDLRREMRQASVPPARNKKRRMIVRQLEALLHAGVNLNDFIAAYDAWVGEVAR